MSAYKTYNDIDIPDDFVLPDGDLVRGKAIFRKCCSQCHTIRRDGRNPYGTLWGPSLYGIVGRTAARNQKSGCQSHSSSLKESGILWTERNLMAFIKNPRAFTGGPINMNFRGIDSFTDRVDLIHFLKAAGHECWMNEDDAQHMQQGWWSRPTANEAAKATLKMAEKAKQKQELRGNSAVKQKTNMTEAKQQTCKASVQKDYVWPPREVISSAGH